MRNKKTFAIISHLIIALSNNTIIIASKIDNILVSKVKLFFFYI